MSSLIFLDIDGVLNTIIVDTEPIEGGRPSPDEDGFYYCINSPNHKRVSNRQAVMWLNLLCKTTGAKIVISSTWRTSLTLAELKETLTNSGLLPEIEIIGCTPSLSYIPDRTRGMEITTYLNNNYGDQWPNFVILDDDSDMDNLKDKLIKCDTYTGLGFHEFRAAFSKLKDL